MSDPVSVKIFDSGLEAIGDAAEKFIAEVGEGLLVRTKRLVPKATYALNDALILETERNGNVATARVGIDPEATSVDYGGSMPIDYGLLVERGTSKMAPQPFLVPALLQTIGSLK